jgi:ATP-binding cassette, subfamily B, bacterial
MVTVFKHIKKQKNLLILALVLAAINQIFSLLDPQVFRLIIDNYATKASTIPRSVFIQGVLLLLLLAVSVALISRIAKNFQDYVVNMITQRVGTAMYSQSVEHTLSLPYAVFEDQRSGEILQKLQKARLDTQTAITSFINTVFLSFIAILFVIVYAFTVHWSIGITYALIIPILGTATYLLSRKIKAAQKTIVAETANLAGSTTETLRNIELVKSLGLERQEITRLNATNEKILQLELKKIRMIRKLSFIQGTIINGMRSILMFIMLWLVFNQSISIGQFFTLFIYSFFVFSPLGELGNIASQYQEAKASNEQLDQILNIKPEEKRKDAKKLNRLTSISFEDVSFKYAQGDDHSLNSVDITIKSGTTIAFVGPSGAGKSTLVKLILGLYKPTIGRLLFNNQDSLDIDYDDLRRRIGLVSQETQLFAGTIRENLKFVNPAATDADCIHVLQMASCAGLLERGGKGLDTRIGEGGIKISGGERQRLSIARALLRNPELIIFDEATSSLDSLTERQITKTIQDIVTLRKNSIIVMIAHRLSTIAHADMIYVLEKGKIIEKGDHDALLKKKGLYYALWREQSAKYED